MKNGWQTTTIGAVCEVANGGTPKTSVATYWGGQHPWITPAEMGNRPSPFIEKTERTLTDLGLQNSSARLLQPYSVILSSRAPIGYVVINTKAMATNQGCKGLIPSKDIEYKFLYYYLISKVDLLNSLGTGATFKEISSSKLKQVPISIPPIPEQKRIVGILDEALSSITNAKANTERNLQNAHALFESHLQSVFSQRGDDKVVHINTKQQTARGVFVDVDMKSFNGGRVTKTGGRAASLRHIPGPLSLAVGMPKSSAKQGWRWTALSDLARLESGHTPSRKHPEYWGGSVAWIGIQDARVHHGHQIDDTFQKTNDLGIANSSARVLPKNTVCLSRTASVGYVVITGKPMATSQDFVNWVCSSNLLPKFLLYLFLAEGRIGLLRYASGSVHQTIYFPEAKGFHICHPDIQEQRKIVQQCDELYSESKSLESLYQQKIAALDELKKTLLNEAFSGTL